jgi:hypothetical protein
MPEPAEEIETKEVPPALTAPEPVEESAAREEIVSAPDDAAAAPETDAALVATEAGADTEPARPRRGRRSSGPGPRPVMFAQPVPPDDPGSEPEKVRRVV